MKDEYKNQMPEDQHAPGYDNDVPVNSWLRGGNESAEGKPGFDKSQAKLGNKGK
jgi:hypothetical protein